MTGDWSHPLDTGHWAEYGTPLHETVHETSIEVLNQCGYTDASDPDDTGQAVEMEMQSELMDLMFRSASFHRFMNRAMILDRASHVAQGITDELGNVLLPDAPH